MVLECDCQPRSWNSLIGQLEPAGTTRTHRAHAGRIPGGQNSVCVCAAANCTCPQIQWPSLGLRVDCYLMVHWLCEAMRYVPVLDDLPSLRMYVLL